MKKPILFRRHAMSSNTKSVKALALIFSFLTLSIFSKADVKTYKWTENYKGYSMKQVPNASKYVAAGTYFQNNGAQLPMSIGYHLVYLDFDGTVWQDVKYVPTSTDIELRVVDVVPMNDQVSCWVVMQARDKSVTPVQEYVYMEKVDLNTGQKSLALPNEYKFRIQGSRVITPNNTYPTCALQLDDDIYIGGYYTDVDASVQHVPPTTTSLNKYAVVFRIAGGTAPVERWAFSSTDGGLYDYDMINSLRVLNGTSIYPNRTVLAIGSGNNYLGVTNSGSVANPHGSGVLLLRFDPQSPYSPIVPISANLLYGSPSSGSGQTPNPEYGMYGMDAVEEGWGIYVTCNSFEEGQKTGWGILRVKSDPYTLNDLRVDPVPSYAHVVPTVMNLDWSKQLFYKGAWLHNGDEWLVSGECIGLPNQDGSCLGGNPQGLPPATNRVSPFFADIRLSYNPGLGINMSMNSYLINSTTLTTTGYQWVDHYTAHPTVAGTMLEDISRLYTPVCEDVWPVSNGAYQLMAPIHGHTPSQTTGPLNAKFVDIDYNGYEPDCQQYLIGCTQQIITTEVDQYLDGTVTIFQVTSQGASPTLNQVIEMPIEDECSNGASHKPTSIANVEDVQKTSIYPNPATNELNIQLGSAFSGKYVFTLTDVTGRTVISTEGVVDGKVKNIKLPTLSTGMYMGIVEANGEQYTEKIIIE